MREMKIAPVKIEWFAQHVKLQDLGLYQGQIVEVARRLYRYSVIGTEHSLIPLETERIERRP